MRTILSILGVCAALVMCAVSGAMNFLFLSSLGKTPIEGQVLGAASAAADLLKALLPFFITWSWAARRYVAAVTGTIAFGFFAGFSFLSAIGFAADNRGVMVETRSTRMATYDRVQRDIQDADARRAALPAHRPPAVIAEDIESHKQSRRWGATKECQNATEAESRAYCERFFTLRAELAAGQEERRLSDELSARQSEVAKLREAGAALERDPQGALLSQIFRQEQDTVRLTLIVVIALLVEIGSSLGLFLATGHRLSAKRHEPALTDEEAIETRQAGSVEDFCLDGLLPSAGERMTADELFAAYELWCDHRGLMPLDTVLFASSFEALSQAVGLTKADGGYAGITVTAPVATLRAAA